MRNPDSSASVWYFAYGSNMQRETLCVRRGVAYRRAVPVRAPGWRLVFDKPSILPTGHATANIVLDASAEVLGVAFEVSTADLDHIELTEGVTVGNYQRVQLDVQAVVRTPDGPRRACSLSSDRRDPALRPSTRYLGLVIEGALEHGLPVEWIEWLRGVPAEPERPESLALRSLIDRALRRPEGS